MDVFVAWDSRQVWFPYERAASMNAALDPSAETKGGGEP